jgi:hypothetical protein
MTTDPKPSSNPELDVKELFALDPDDRPQGLRELIDELTGAPVPATGQTPASAVSDTTPAASNDTAELRRLLTLPADQRPDWLNTYLGDMTIPPIPDTSTNPLLDVVMANTAYGEKNCTLAFPLDKVLAAAEHAAAADKHKPSYGETEAAPCLWWVKDDGTYLMSNGQDPNDTRDHNGRLPHVVHADGWGPGTDARSILGGDDFRESIDLTTPIFEDGTTLLGMLREAAAAGATRFQLKATFDDTYMDLTYITA